MKMLEITHLVWYTILDVLFLTKNTFNLNHDDQAYLVEGLRAAMFLADNKIKGFVHLTPCKDGYTVSEFIPPQEKQPDYPSPFFKEKKIPKKGYFTCGVYYIPAPIYYEEEQIVRFPCVLLGFDDKDQLMTTAPQIKYNPQEMLKDFTNYFTKYCPKVITVRDDRTEALLKNYCESMDIAIMRSDFIPHLEEIYNDFCSHLDARSNDELIDERLIELVESLSAEELSTAPLPLLEILVSDPEVPENIRKKAEKAMKLR